MRKGFGICCIILGICCLLSSLGLLLYNRWEEENAQNASQQILLDVRESIQKHTGEETGEEKSDWAGAAAMPAAQVDGYDCIGVLTIPVLNLELPVLADWSYAKLKKAPCLYYGSCYESDFVIAAHNYDAHFGRLSQLQVGDEVVFTDVNGTVHSYAVALLETLPKEATREMIASGFDLSLYTCTPGGGNRVTVRCNRR